MSCLAPLAWPQSTDTVFIAGSSDQASGRIVSADKDNVVIETAFAGPITIKVALVTRIVVDGHEFTPAALDGLQAALTARTAAAKAETPVPAAPAAESAAAPAAPTKAGAHGFLKQFSGSVGVGATLTQATSSTRGLTIDVNLYRASLDKVGQAPRTETGLIFNQSVNQFLPKSGPANKADSFSADLSHAVRVSGKWSAFGLAGYERVSSDDLQLLQLYAGGLSYTGWNQNGNRFEIRVGPDFVKKSYGNPKLSHALFGVIVEEQYWKTLPSGFVLKQNYRIDRAFSHPEDVDSTGSITVDTPISKVLSFRTSLIGRYLNVVPRGDKRLSFEASAGLDLMVGSGTTASMKGKRRRLKKQNKKK